MQTSRSPGLLILGASGHGRVVADAAAAQGCWRSLRATDRNPQRCQGELLPGVTLVGIELLASAEAIHVAIGDAAARAREIAGLPPARLATVVHPRSMVSAHAVVGPACFLAAAAVVAAAARLGQGVIVNHGAVVDHDCEVADYSHLAPQSCLGGGVRVGARTLVGAGARVLPGLSIAGDVTIGAGAVVCSSIAEPGVYAGVPARKIR